MAAKLSPAQRLQFGAHAWQLSLRGMTAQTIADKIEERFNHAITEKTVDRLLHRQAEINAKLVADTMDQATSRYVAEQRANLAESWRRSQQRSIPPAAAAQHLRNAQNASTNVARALGVFVEKVDVTTQGESLIRRYIGVDVDMV